MCGICGKISLNTTNNIKEGLIRRMCDALKHRGPDDEGVYIKQPTAGSRQPTVALGHRRLSIIDLSQAGHQPMTNEDGSIWIVMNGEVYNFPELRISLEKKGHTFKSHTDTEVIIHLYEETGAACVEDLRGMFAFAIWDQRRERLFLARDRLGQKPLFYSAKNNELVFASEIGSLLEDDGISRAVEPASIDSFLTYKYIQAPATIFKDVRSLEPAHFLIWEKGNVKVSRYWRLDYSQKLKASQEEYCERILDLLRECTRMRMISDVPLGAFLSGGIDSSAIVAMMAGLTERPVKTFSIGFEDKSFNETPYARAVAKKFATEHREFIVKPNALQILPELIAHFGQPYGDSSAIPTYYLAKMTRQDVTVALNGDAGDESFGGYERYAATRMAEKFKGPLTVFNRFFGRSIGKIPESTRKRDLLVMFKKFLKGIDLEASFRYSRYVGVFGAEERTDVYSDYMCDEMQKQCSEDMIANCYSDSKTADLLDATLYTDLMTYMPGDLLPKVDITSMAHSLEARSPFLDHKFLEFSAGIPSNLKVKGLTTKYILKKALKKVLPADIINRKKVGFGVPVGAWFRGELKSYVNEILLSERSLKRGYFKKDALRQILSNHAEGKVNNGEKIWCLLNLELWHRMFIDKEGYKGSWITKKAEGKSSITAQTTS